MTNQRLCSSFSIYCLFVCVFVWCVASPTNFEFLIYLYSESQLLTHTDTRSWPKREQVQHQLNISIRLDAKNLWFGFRLSNQQRQHQLYSLYASIRYAYNSPCPTTVHSLKGSVVSSWPMTSPTSVRWIVVSSAHFPQTRIRHVCDWKKKTIQLFCCVLVLFS